ncbi:MAG: DnaD domain protein [Clostridia bacterium]|nr:DnaD domain protein [Clostridia bacterium]
MNTESFFILPKISYDTLLRASADSLRVLIVLGQSPDVSFEKLRKTLGFDRERLVCALDFWRDEKVLSEADVPRPPTSKHISPSAKEIAETLYNSNFSFAKNEAESVWGTLSRTHLNALLFAHNNMGLSIESIVLLLRRLKDTGQTELRHFERAALDWSKRGLKDAKAAEAYIDELTRGDAYAERISKALGISFETMNENERRTAASWEKLCISDEAIIDAYRRSLPYTKGNSPFAYMNKIIIKDANAKKSAPCETANIKEASAPQNPAKKRYDYARIRKLDREYLKSLKDENI